VADCCGDAEIDGAGDGVVAAVGDGKGEGGEVAGEQAVSSGKNARTQTTGPVRIRAAAGAT
jgi:hypothetical protein